MKVGVLTYHNTANYGAALQAYATLQALADLGVDAEIIDYTNEYRRGSYSVHKRFVRQLRHGQLLQAGKTLAGTPMILSRAKNFRAFYRAYLKKSPSVFRTMRSLRENPPIYDAYLVGSDQVWNYRNSGDDLNYMLDFVSDKSKTISYASSFGLECIPENRREKYAGGLNGIRAISVREKTGAALVTQLTGRQPEIVLDPVFLPEKRLWHEFAGETGVPKRPYILLYTSRAGCFSEFQKNSGFDLSRMDIVKIGTDLSPMDMFHWRTRVRSTVGPKAFLGYIKNADLVLTSSFHGTAFSILMEKPFFVFLSGDKGRDSRIVELLSGLGLSDRICNAKMTENSVARKIDYSSVNQNLSVLQKQSIRFLANALQQISPEKRSQ